MGRILLFAASALLLATAAVHASGQAMVNGWTEGLDHRQAMAICLVWITDSVSWAVVSALWAMAGWTRQRAWLGAATIAAVIPLTMFIGMMGIDPTFFGGWMLLGSVALAAGGIFACWRGSKGQQQP